MKHQRESSFYSINSPGELVSLSNMTENKAMNLDTLFRTCLEYSELVVQRETNSFILPFLDF